MSKEINRIHWKCRRGMREIDLLLREFSKHSLEKLSDDQLLLFEEILNYDDLIISNLNHLFVTQPIMNQG